MWSATKVSLLWFRYSIISCLTSAATEPGVLKMSPVVLSTQAVARPGRKVREILWTSCVS